MEKKKLKAGLDWQRWMSQQDDLKNIEEVTSVRMLFSMFLINAFEQSVIKLKSDDCVWGPIHISIGQEALAAATIAALRKGDKIAGSHRAHHIFLAKVLEYVLPEGWDPRTDALTPEGQTMATKTLAEIMGLSIGYCGGRGGSMHLRYEAAGVLGTNAIVAGGVPLSAGAAFAEKLKKSGNILICFLGDGAANQGSFHEACNLAGLWDLPIIYLIENNQYAVATPVQHACAIEDLSLHAASYGMSSRIVDGFDVPAIYQAVNDAADQIRNGGKPFIIEAKCYRHFHHGGDLPGSAYGYRDKSEEQKWLERDALVQYPKGLVAAGRCTEDHIIAIQEAADAAIQQAVEECTIPGASKEAPRVVRAELWPQPESVSDGVRSDGSEFSNITFKKRADFDTYRDIKYSDAIAAVTGRWLERDAQCIVMGEEVANFGGGAYGATKGLPKKYPDRVLNTPISECGFSGMGLGMAMSGVRTLVEIMFPDFTLVAADQIFNQIGKARHMYGGTTDIPLVLRTRIATGNGYGGQHSMDPIGLYALFSGWRIVAPGNAHDYIGLFNAAMQSLDPVLVLEHHSLYEREFPVPSEDLDYVIPFGSARVLSEGRDITVLTYASMGVRLESLLPAFAERSLKPEIIDLRTLDFAAMDFETIGASLEKTGAVAIVEEAAGGHSIGRRITSEITERFFDLLDAPPGCISSLDVPPPVSRVLEAAAMVDDAEIIETISAIAARKWR